MEITKCDKRTRQEKCRSRRIVAMEAFKGPRLTSPSWLFQLQRLSRTSSDTIHSNDLVVPNFFEYLVYPYFLSYYIILLNGAQCNSQPSCLLCTRCTLLYSDLVPHFWGSRGPLASHPSWYLAGQDWIIPRTTEYLSQLAWGMWWRDILLGLGEMRDGLSMNDQDDTHDTNVTHAPDTLRLCTHVYTCVHTPRPPVQPRLPWALRATLFALQGTRIW